MLPSLTSVLYVQYLNMDICRDTWLVVVSPCCLFTMLSLVVKAFKDPLPQLPLVVEQILSCMYWIVMC